MKFKNRLTPFRIGNFSDKYIVRVVYTVLFKTLSYNEGKVR